MIIASRNVNQKCSCLDTKCIYFLCMKVFRNMHPWSSSSFMSTLLAYSVFDPTPSQPNLSILFGLVSFIHWLSSQLCHFKISRHLSGKEVILNTFKLSTKLCWWSEALLEPNNEWSKWSPLCTTCSNAPSPTFFCTVFIHGSVTLYLCFLLVDKWITCLFTATSAIAVTMLTFC